MNLPFTNTRLFSQALDDLRLFHSPAPLFLRTNSVMAREPLLPCCAMIGLPETPIDPTSDP